MVRWSRPSGSSESLASPPTDPLHAAGISPEALYENQPSVGRYVMPGAERAHRLRERPQQVSGDNRIERTRGYGCGLRLDDLDLEPCLLRLGSESSKHPRREIDGRHMVAELRHHETEEPGSGTHIEDACRNHWQQTLEGPPPRGTLQRGDRVMTRVTIIGGGVNVPITADLLDKLAVHRRPSLRIMRAVALVQAHRFDADPPMVALAHLEAPRRQAHSSGRRKFRASCPWWDNAHAIPSTDRRRARPLHRRPAGPPPHTRQRAARCRGCQLRPPPRRTPDA
jgi:hypothetical protein